MRRIRLVARVVPLHDLNHLVKQRYIVPLDLGLSFFKFDVGLAVGRVVDR
jgi:hypothetical protein